MHFHFNVLRCSSCQVTKLLQKQRYSNWQGGIVNYKLKRNESRKKKRIKNGKIEKHFVWSQGVAFLIALVLTLGLFQGGAFPQKEKEGLASVFSRRAVLAAKGKENEPGASYLGKSDWLSMGSRFQEKENGARPTKADSEKDQPLEKRQGTSTFAVSTIAAEEESPRISKIAQEAGPSAFVSENPSLALKKEEESEKKADPVRSEKIYSLDQFRYLGVILWGNYRYTFYSQSVLPGNLLSIPGRHLDEEGYVVDEEGYIVLASSAPRGTVFPTPFGRFGKVYDKGTSGNHLDVYIR